MDNFKDEKIQELSVTTMIFKTKNMVFKKKSFVYTKHRTVCYAITM